MFRRPLLSLLLICLVVTAVGVASPNALSYEEQQAGWRLLFDGETFNGWTGLHGHPFPEGHWVIKDGSLGTVPGAFRNDIMSTEAFEDFELSLEWRVPPGGNSGVFYELLDYPRGLPELYRTTGLALAAVLLLGLLVFRSMRRGVRGLGARARKRVAAAMMLVLAAVLAWTVFNGVRRYFWLHTKAGGYEMQVFAEAARRETGVSTRTAGALYDLIPPQLNAARPAGEFNLSRVVVRGRRAEHWLNGVKVVEFEMESPEMTRRIARSKYSSLEGFGRKSRTAIALQNHGQEAWFRNIKIRPLPSAE